MGRIIRRRTRRRTWWWRARRRLIRRRFRIWRSCDPKEEATESAEQMQQWSPSASDKTQNLSFVSPRKTYRVQRWTSKCRKSGPGLRWMCQDLLLERLQSDSNRINRSLHLSLLEDDSRRTTCILLWPCDQLNTIQVPRIAWRRSFVGSKKA